MGRNTVVLFPGEERILSSMGENIKLARLRRNLSAVLVAERAGISRQTLTKIEKGDQSVAIGNYMAVLRALAMQKEFLKIAADDVVGRTYQDLGLVTRKRAPKRKKEESAES